MDALLHPSLWRWLLFAGQPVRLVIAANVFLGRSIRSLVRDILRRLRDILRWLGGRWRIRRLADFERQYFQIKRWHAAGIALIGVYAGSFAVRAWNDYISGRTAQRKRLYAVMASATDYQTWFNATAELEKLTPGHDSVQQADIEGRLYDRRLLQQRSQHLQAVRERGDPVEMMFALRSDLLRNLGNMANANLHEILLQVPEPIRAYIDEVRTHLRIIATASTPPIDDRLAFLRETRHAFGRTALVLSGGGSFGSFHLGVVDALLKSDLLPRVLSGSSAGAIVAALICTRTPEELAELFADLPERLQGIELYASNTASQVLRHLVLKGTLQDHNVLQERLQRLLGDVTFQEAYARSGRILNVSVSAADTSEPPRLLNYLTAPNVIVWSAVACSSAFPFLFAPQTLLARDSKGHVVPFSHQTAGEAQRRWRDGSLEEDLPMCGLSEMFNVNYFLVSQCNPYLLPIISAKRAVPRLIGSLAEQEFKHRCKQLMEILPRSFGASRVLKLLSQPWEGDITMVLPASSFSTLKAIVNLSRDDLLRSLAEGQRAAWTKLSAIAANCDIEVTLDESLRFVTAAARRERARIRRRASYAALPLASGGISNGGTTGGMRAGIPSWLHLQALGLSHSESHETLGANTPTAAAAAAAHDEIYQNIFQNGMTHGISHQRIASSGGGPGSPFHHQPFIPASSSAAAAGMMLPQGARPVSRIPSAPQVDLTDTIMPEDSELRNSEDGTALGQYGEGIGIGNLEDDASEEGPASTTVVLGMPTTRAMTMSLGCGDDVWRDLFTVVPATTSDALDFIAP